MSEAYGDCCAVVVLTLMTLLACAGERVALSIFRSLPAAVRGAWCHRKASRTALSALCDATIPPDRINCVLRATRAPVWLLSGSCLAPAWLLVDTTALSVSSAPPAWPRWRRVRI